MPYLSDTQRVELALPIYGASDIIVNGVADRDNPERKRCIGLLQAAHVQVYEGLMNDRCASIMRRVERTYKQVMGVNVSEGGSVAKAGLITFHWLSIVLESGYLVLPPDTPLAMAFSLILPNLQHLADIGPVNASAEKQARKVLTRLNALGLYVGIKQQQILETSNG